MTLYITPCVMEFKRDASSPSYIHLSVTLIWCVNTKELLLVSRNTFPLILHFYSRRYTTNDKRNVSTAAKCLVSGRQVPATETDVLHVRKPSRAKARSVPGEFIKNSQQNPQSLNFSVVYVDCLSIRSIIFLLMTFHFTFVKKLLLK